MSSSLRETVSGGNAATTAPGVAPAGSRPANNSVHSNEPLVRDASLDEKKLTRKEKLRKHWKRFWACYVIGLIIFLAIFLPLFFLKIIPAIVQLLVNQANLPINGGALVAYSPDELKVTVQTRLDIPRGIKASLDPVTLNMYNRNTTEFSPFLSVDLPTTYLDGPTEVVVADKIVKVGNRSELIKWFRVVVANKYTDLSIRGDSTVRIGALKSDVHLEKTTSVATLDNLRGFAALSIRLVIPPDADGYNIKGQVLLPNWSPLSIGLGNVTLNLFAGQVLLGNAYLENVVAVPGNNTFDFRGKLFLEELLPNIGPILLSQAEALGRGNLALTASGNSTIVNGQHITFLEDVLNSQRFYTEIPVVALLTQVLGGFLAPDGDGTTALMDTLSKVLGNQTLIDSIVGKLNTSNVIDRLNTTAAAIPAKLLRRVQREMAKTVLKTAVRDFKASRSKTLWHPITAE